MVSRAFKVKADGETPAMLSEITFANLYLPPFLLYVGAAALIYMVLERLMRRWLDWTWHPSLTRFFVSLIVLSTLIVKL